MSKRQYLDDDLAIQIQAIYDDTSVSDVRLSYICTHYYKNNLGCIRVHNKSMHDIDIGLLNALGISYITKVTPIFKDCMVDVGRPVFHRKYGVMKMAGFERGEYMLNSCSMELNCSRESFIYLSKDFNPNLNICIEGDESWSICDE